MTDLFLHILNMSLTAGVLVVAVVLLRAVFYKAPRWVHCLLWALVAVRLLCPITIESSLSLMPDTTAVLAPLASDSAADTTAPDTSVDNIVGDIVTTPVPDTPVVPPITDTPPVTELPPAATTDPDDSLSVSAPAAEADPWQMILTVAAWTWLVGVVAMAVYALATTLRLRRQVEEAAHLSGNIWLCDHLRSPFILGVLRPRIYLPSDLDGAARDSVVAHEQAHLKRLDHFWKPLGFLLLAVYWFNPILWAAYILLCRDIEAACDERVVRHLSADARRTYSEALLACSAPRRLISACPLAFGETGVKSRIKSVLSYKKPTVWIMVVALLVSTVAGVCLLTDPPADDPQSDDPPVVTDDGEAPKYATFVHTGEPKAKVQLELDGNECTYTNSTLSSWVAVGTYTMGESSVTLSFPDETMTIEFEGDFTGLKFCMGQSDTRMSYEQMSFGDEQLKDGAVFRRIANVSDVPYTAETFYSRNWLSEALQQEMREKYQYRTGNYSDKDWPIIPIASRDQLDDFFATYENDVSDFGFATADTSAYDDAFFAEKMLLAVYYRNGSSSVKPEIAAVEYNGAELVTVQVDVYEPSIRNAMLGQWFMLAEIPLDEIPYATAFRAVERYHIPTDYYFATYSHPIPDDGQNDVSIGRYSIFSYGRETLVPLVESLEWYGADIMTETTFTAIGHFCFEGEKKYYVSPDKKQLYDGEQIADLTAEQSEQLDFYLRDGNPGEDVATASVTGTVTQWSKEGGYLMLEVTDGDSKLGSQVKVYTGILAPGSGPAVGYPATIYYDGWYQTDAGYSTIYAIHRKWMDADLLGGPEDDEPTNPTTPGKPVEKWLDYTVIVKDQDGNLVSGVKISISSEMIADIITTDSKGVAKTNLPEGIPTGTIEVPQGYVAASKKFTFAAGSTSLTIVLEKEQPVTPAAAVVFNCTRENKLSDRQRQELFGASSVVSIDSVDALKSFKNTYGSLNLGLYPEEYDAAFFEKYALLLTCHETGSGMARPRAAVYTYSADGTVLSVNVDEFWPSGLVTDDIGEWLILSVIQKADLKGVTNLTSQLRSKLPSNSISFLAHSTADPHSAVGEGTKALNSIESDVLNSYLISSMIDEEWGRWTPSSEVLFDVKLVINHNTYFYDIDSGRIVVTDGYMVHTLAYTMQFSFLPARTNMIDWVLARYSDANDEVWIWEDFESRYYKNDAQPLNTSEMRAIALRTNWAENNSRNRTYDAQYTIGGALYLIDLEHEEVLTADEKQASPLTKEEVAYLRSVLEAE